jgi:tyrosyl-tRNA synthetase
MSPRMASTPDEKSPDRSRETLAFGEHPRFGQPDDEIPARPAGHSARSRATNADPGRLAALLKNAVDCLPEGALAEKLAEARAEGRPLRVKLGIDPTAPDIHLGHAVVLGKLREFQEEGHVVVLIIGDYTARVGDPSGRSTLRPMLSAQEIEANAATFQEQALRILDAERVEVRRNSEWLAKIDLLGLTRTTTVAQLLAREDFATRWAAQQPISMLELMYPLLQGYDSVAVCADVELGGTDQKFNLLLGRDIQRAYGAVGQAILTMPLLVGLDGRQKMSKSLGNQIGITDPPGEVYGKTLSLPDEAMGEYYRLLLHREPPATGEMSARDAKRLLARELVGWLHSPAQAVQAEADFDRVFVRHETPQVLEEAHVTVGADGTIHLPRLIAATYAMSSSEARRLIDQGGVSLNGAPLDPGRYDVASEDARGAVLRVGRRRFLRLLVQ